MDVTPRLNRLLGADGKCFMVAIDHGFFNDYRFLEGIQDIRTAIGTVVVGGADALLLSVGQAPKLQEIPGRNKPSLALRVDTSNVYSRVVPGYTFDHMLEGAVEQAVALDATCVTANLFMTATEPELYHACIANIVKLKRQCELYGMPLMVEPMCLKPDETGKAYTDDIEITNIIALVRQTAELGADLIKSDPSGSPEEYHRVIEAASGAVVLPRGGGKVALEEVFRRTAMLMEQGARGVVYGRNVLQHQYPDRMMKAFLGVVHEGFSSEQAMAVVRGEA